MNEADLRTTLAVMAHEVDVPDDLAGRTIDAVRALRDEKTTRRRPRWAYVVISAAAAVLVFVAGTFVAANRPGKSFLAKRSTQNSSTTNGSTAVIEAPAQGGGSNSRDAVAGQVAETSASSGSGTVSGPAVSAPYSVIGLKDLPQVVHTADIKVQVKNFERSWGHANDVASSDGGYVTDSKTSESSDRVGSGTLTIRVPSANLEPALHDLRALGTMTALTTSGNDVSAPMADLNARKKDAEAEEASLQNLLNNANSVSDVLDIKSRLNDTRNQIESIEGQLHGYQDQVDFATIHATMFDAATTPREPLLGTGTLGRSIHTAGHLALTVVAGAVVAIGLLFPLTLLALLGWFVVRKVRYRTR
jgi:hypothetical protein